MDFTVPQHHYDYKIDSEGHLWIENSEISDPVTLKFFMKHLEILHDGSFQVLCMGEINHVTVEDVPYVIQNLSVHPQQIELCFPGDYREILDPRTLWVGMNNVLYCKVRNGAFTARFNRKSYWEITRQIQQDSLGNFYLSLGGLCYEIASHSPTKS